MAYNANIPQPTNRLRNSQNDLLQNFMAIDTGFSLNHMGLNEAAGVAGKHKFLTMPQQSPLPDTTAYGTDLLFGVALYAPTGLSELFLKRNTDGANPGTPLTAGATTDGGKSGWTILPSGVLMNWGETGTHNFAANETFTYPAVTFAKAFTGNTFVVIATANSTEPDASTFRITWQKENPFNASQVVLKGTSNTAKTNVRIDFIAIGL